jgi:hypothetical protein
MDWQSVSTNQFILSLDHDDPNLNEYLNIFPKWFKLKPMPRDNYSWITDNHLIIVNNNGSSVAAINNAAKIAYGDILMVVSDDTEPCESWPDHIHKLSSRGPDWIAKTQDGIQDWIITMPIMDRAYYNRFGYIYHPSYKHLFCDTELTCVADITGRKIVSNLMFPHNHYSIGKSEIDDIYRKNDATNAEGERIFLERYKRNFDLPPGNKIQDKGMINWLQKRHVYA